MNKILTKIHPQKNHAIFIVGTFIFLTIMSIVWGVSYASTTPSDPTNLHQTNLQQITSPATYSNSISLSWNYNIDPATNIIPQYFIVERKSSTTAFTELKNRPAFYDLNAYNYIDSENIISGILYDYRVKACLDITTDVLSSGGVASGITSSCSGYSNEFKGAFVGTNPNTTSVTPNSPTNLVSTNTSTDALTSIGLSWMDNSNNESIFKIIRTSNGVNTNIEVPSNIPTGTGTITYQDINSDRNIISRGTSYSYQIQACAPITAGTTTQPCSLLVSSYPSSVTIPALVTTPVAPVAPTNFKINPDKLLASIPIVELSWTDSSTNETIFNIKRISSSNTLTGTTSGTNALTFSKDSISTTGVGSIIIIVDPNAIVKGSLYYYQIQACAPITAGTTTQPCSAAVTISVTIPNPIVDTITVVAPTNLSLKDISTLTSTSGSVSLTWNDNSTNESQFIIERRTSTDILSTSTNFHTKTDAVSFIDSQVIRGISYYYRIKACAAVTTLVTGATPNCSPYSNIAGITIPVLNTVVAVSAPTNLVLSSNLSSSSSYIPLKWTDNSNNETQFVLERKLSSEIIYSPMIHYLDPNINYFTDTAVANGVSYDYRVKACVASATAGAAPICSSYAQLSKILIPAPVIVPIASIDTTIAPVEITTVIVVPKNTLTTTTAKIASPTVTPENIVQTITQLTPQVVTPPAPVPVTEVSVKIVDISIIVDDIKTSVDSTKKQLTDIVNNTVLDIITRNQEAGRKIDSVKIYSYRHELLNKIDSSLLNLTVINSVDVNNLKIEVNNGIEYIKTIAGESDKITQVDSTNLNNITKAINDLSGVVIEKSIAIKENGGDLLYKDTNNDGVSNYDSVYVYNIDPVKPSPVSTYEGRNINAAEKILLGFNPASPEIIKITPQQPAASAAVVIPSYKVKEVKLTDKKEILIGGQALPNSFITLYIYSTPIMVTVKTDSNGEWQYVLDKELENGDHTVYAATVNNTGNIVAKSSGFLFTKTAEAITFQDLPIAEASINIEKPGLLGGINIYLIIAALVAVFVIVLTLTGLISKKTVKAE